VAVYTGILPITQSEAGLAVVLGHEIAHAIAKHGAERMSQGLLLSLGQESLAVAMRNKPAQTRALAMQAFGLGANVGRRAALRPKTRIGSGPHRPDLHGQGRLRPPGSRGLLAPHGHRVPGRRAARILSTHPHHDTRVANLHKWMAEAIAVYNANKN
jgi:Zn-dependent protease with chaperone function